MVFDKIRTLYATAVCNGLGICVFRIGYELRKKLGLLKQRFPACGWSELNLSRWFETQSRPEEIIRQFQSNGRRLFFNEHNLPRITDEQLKQQIISGADEILSNKLRYFFAKSYYMGEKPDWFLNPQTGQRISPDKHWTEIEHFDANAGDIKFIWEPSRFAWAYTLVRAYSVTSQEIYAEKFWSLFESWLDSNQPNMGPNFACGQECAIRLMAMCFALYGLTAAKASSVERKIKLILAIAFHAERIEKNIGFAISTRTNHAMSEAAGLYTAGLLFPEFKDSTQWVAIGKKVLIQVGIDQIYTDGSHIQHSMNYLRLILQDYLWAIRLGQLNSDDFPKGIISRVAKAVEFIYQNQDEKNGRVPNYGSNDGSVIIPLNGCDYNDFRPVLQSCWYLIRGEKLYENGPWDEDLLWFFGPDAVTKPAVKKQRKSTAFSSGGYYTLRGEKSWAMFRCHSYRTRVGHIDPLHVDLWADGVNLLRDSGSYGYFIPKEPQLEYYFKSIWAHNTVIVDGAEPAQLISRFMWWPLLKSKLLKFAYEKNKGEVVGENSTHCNSSGRIIHRRHIVVKNDRWEITDEILGQDEHGVELRWQLPAAAQIVSSKADLTQVNLSNGWQLEVNSNETAILRAESNAGYESLFYGYKQPSATLSIKKEGRLPIVFRSVIWKMD